MSSALYVSSPLNLYKRISLTIISHNCFLYQESFYETVVTCNAILNPTKFITDPLSLFIETTKQNHKGTASTVDVMMENKAPENCSGVFAQLLFAYYSRPYNN